MSIPSTIGHLVINHITNITYIEQKKVYRMLIHWKNDDLKHPYSSIVYIPQNVFYSVSLYQLKIQQSSYFLLDSLLQLKSEIIKQSKLNNHLNQQSLRVNSAIIQPLLINQSHKNLQKNQIQKCQEDQDQQYQQVLKPITNSNNNQQYKNISDKSQISTQKLDKQNTRKLEDGNITNHPQYNHHQQHYLQKNQYIKKINNTIILDQMFDYDNYARTQKNFLEIIRERNRSLILIQLPMKLKDKKSKKVKTK